MCTTDNSRTIKCVLYTSLTCPVVVVVVVVMCVCVSVGMRVRVTHCSENSARERRATPVC